MHDKPEAAVLAALRTTYKMTQVEAAELLCVTPACYRTWEQGVRKVPQWVLEYYSVLLRYKRGEPPKPEDARWRYGLINGHVDKLWSEYDYSSAEQAYDLAYPLFYQTFHVTPDLNFRDEKSRTLYLVAKPAAFIPPT